MIDKRYQKQGFGREAVRLALEFVRTWPHGKAEACVTSYNPENEAAKKLYLPSDSWKTEKWTTMKSWPC